LVESLEARLTSQFYDWEIRGRGWIVWPEPVRLEPPFRKFSRYIAPANRPIDDGRKPTLLSSIADGVKGLFTSPAPAADLNSALPSEEEEQPAIDNDEDPIRELSLVLPPDYDMEPEVAESFLLGLGHTQGPISFEVIGTHEAINIQFAVRASDEFRVIHQIQAFSPGVVIKQQDSSLYRLWSESRQSRSVIVDFGLSNEFMLPILAFSEMKFEPLIGTIGPLSHLQPGEVGASQILFQPVTHPWAESTLRSVIDYDGQPFFADAPHITKFARHKVGRPMFAVMVRVAAKAHTKDRAWHIARSIGSALNQYANPPANEFIPLSDEDYGKQDHEDDLLRRKTRRSGMLLNSDELVGLVHLPSPSVQSEKLKREVIKTKAAPAISLNHKLILGANSHNGQIRRVTLNPDQRTRHMYVIGASGTGKTTLLLNLIIQDIQNGDGIGVLDPHGDLIEQILQYVPEHRYKDVIVFDPADEEYPIAFNILSAHSELDKQLLSSDLISVFRRLSTAWGDQMTSVLGNAILAFLESTRAGTLGDLRRFLVEPDFRNEFLKSVGDEGVVYYWRHEFPLLVGKPQGPILTRLDTFLRPKLIRNMVNQPENRLDFRSIMDSKKIFLAKLSQGSIGEENAYLLGSLVVSKLHQAAMSRQDVKESQRSNYYLYIDEFHNFITPSMAAILSGARKYRLGLVVAHQEFRQLWNRDTDVASAVIANPYTRICFRLGDFDAQKLAEGFSFFDAKDLQRLSTGQALARIERSDYDFNLTTFPLAKPQQGFENRIDRIVELSRQTYATRLEPAAPAASAPSRVEVAKQVVVETPQPTESRVEPTQKKPKKQKMAVKTDSVTSELVKPESAKLGRGGPQHKYLQELIKRLAEDRGYLTTIEKAILAGTGSVDVSMEKGDTKIACEISISTSAEHECTNIKKCLAAGFSPVVMIASDKRHVGKIRTFVEKNLDGTEFTKVMFLTVDDFVEYLNSREIEIPETQESVVKGYKVKVHVKHKDRGIQEDAISSVLAQAMKRLSNRAQK
jgi:hypothetical protein